MPLVIEIDEYQVCRVCGCTDEDCYCCYEHSTDVCHWTEADLGSTCASGEPCPGDESAAEGPECSYLDLDREPVWVRTSADEETVRAITELVRFLKRTPTNFWQRIVMRLSCRIAISTTGRSTLTIVGQKAAITITMFAGDRGRGALGLRCWSWPWLSESVQ